MPLYLTLFHIFVDIHIALEIALHIEKDIIYGVSHSAYVLSIFQKNSHQEIFIALYSKIRSNAITRVFHVKHNGLRILKAWFI